MQSYITAEISASAVEANTRAVRAVLGPRTKLCAVMKADFLGHGVALLWRTVAPLADCVAVATPEESLQLRQLGYAGPLLQLLPSCGLPEGPALAEALAELIRARVTLTLWSPLELAPLAAAAAATGADAEVHIKVDTGMSRGGAAPEAALGLLAAARRTLGIRVTGVYTHFATADEPDPSPAREQLHLFREWLDLVPRREELLAHAANSAATFAMPDSHLDMVRSAVALVGYQFRYDSLKDRLPLRPAMRLWAPLTQVKRLPEGAPVGYGRTKTLRRPSVTGLVPVGYGDGYLRCLSNRATMRVGGRDVPVIGRVSMDQTIVDLTDVPGARTGDEAEIISANPANANSLENLSHLAGTIPQELSCRLACRVRRVLVP